MNGGCLGSGLINSHRVQLRLHGNPHGNPPPPPRQPPRPWPRTSKCRPLRSCRAASSNPDLKTSTQTARVRYKRQTSDETHNSLLVLYPEWTSRDRKEVTTVFWGTRKGAKSAVCQLESGLEASTHCRQTRPPAAEASQPHTLGKEPKCDSEGDMGCGAKGTEAGENLACSQTTWWSGVGGDDGCSAKGHGAARQDPGTQHPGKPWAAGLQEVHLAQSAQREEGEEGPQEGQRLLARAAFHDHATGGGGTGTSSWACQGQEGLGDSRWYSCSPAAAPTPAAALAPGVWCSRHHEEQHNRNDVHPLQAGQVDKETERKGCK